MTRPELPVTAHLIKEIEDGVLDALTGRTVRVRGGRSLSESLSDLGPRQPMHPIIAGDGEPDARHIQTK